MPVAKSQGVDIHYRDAGEGVPILFSHSLLVDGSVWNAVIERLVPGVRCLNVDMRSHGESTATSDAFDLGVVARDLAAVLDHAGVPNAIWCGVSVGAMASLRAALEQADRVRGLILVNGDAEAEGFSGKLQLRAAGLLARVLGAPALASAFAPKAFAAPTVKDRPALVAEVRERMARFDSTRLGPWVECLASRSDLTPRLAELRVPTLVLSGTLDASFAPRKSELLHQRISGSQIEHYARGGHLVCLEEPEAVASAIRRFASAS